MHQITWHGGTLRSGCCGALLHRCDDDCGVFHCDECLAPQEDDQRLRELEMPRVVQQLITAAFEYDRDQRGPHNPCSDHCPGWALFDSDNRGRVIQRCDDCDRFQYDSDAVDHVAGIIASGAYLLSRLWGEGRIPRPARPAYPLAERTER